MTVPLCFQSFTKWFIRSRRSAAEGRPKDRELYRLSDGKDAGVSVTIIVGEHLMRSFSIPAVTAILFLLAGCASSPVDESARLVGREGDVRIDALMTGLRAGGGSTVNITYEVENLRPEPIAIADIVPEAMYDPDTGLITVLIGSEVPGNQFLPRLDADSLGRKEVVFNRGESERIIHGQDALLGVFNCASVTSRMWSHSRLWSI